MFNQGIGWIWNKNYIYLAHDFFTSVNPNFKMIASSLS